MGGFFDWLRGERRLRPADSQLLHTFLTLEQQRLTAMAQLDDKRSALEMRKLELEIEHAETLQKVRTEEREASAKLRQQQREWAAAARDRKRQKEVTAKQTAGDQPGCRVCHNPSDLTLTPDEINRHNFEAHPNRPVLFSS